MFSCLLQISDYLILFAHLLINYLWNSQFQSSWQLIAQEFVPNVVFPFFSFSQTKQKFQLGSPRQRNNNTLLRDNWHRDMTESVAKTHRISKLPMQCCEYPAHSDEDWTAHDFLARRGWIRVVPSQHHLCHPILTQHRDCPVLCIPGSVTSLPCSLYPAWPPAFKGTAISLSFTAHLCLIF